jgi:hypothetical protein
MTEPTHHLRRDVAAQLDVILTIITTQIDHHDRDAARRYLRQELGAAWSLGESAGWRASFEDEQSAPNPYDEIA